METTDLEKGNLGDKQQITKKINSNGWVNGNLSNSCVAEIFQEKLVM